MKDDIRRDALVGGGETSADGCTTRDEEDEDENVRVGWQRKRPCRSPRSNDEGVPDGGESAGGEKALHPPG